MIIKLLRKKVDYVVAVSEGVKNSLKWFLFENCQLRVIYNPVITPHLINRIETLSSIIQRSNSGKLLFVGRLVPAKGIDVLLEAFEYLSDKFNVELTIIGEGPLRSYIENWVTKRRLKLYVHLLGYIKDPIPYFMSHDIFLLPSRREGFGNVIVEALACGTQIISTDCPSGPSEILANGRFGQLVPVDDVNSLVAAIVASLERSELVSTNLMKERAMAFKSAEIAKSYLKLLSANGVQDS